MIPERDFILLIVIGNTFLKWGLFRPSVGGTARENRVESGHALLEEIMTLSSQLAKLPTPARIVISNVAGTRVRATAIRMLEVWPDAPAPYWLVPQDAQCGVVNSYRNPQQLGSDRWAALIGARHLLGSRPVMVVVCGTATTIVPFSSCSVGGLTSFQRPFSTYSTKSRIAAAFLVVLHGTGTRSAGHGARRRGRRIRIRRRATSARPAGARSRAAARRSGASPRNASVPVRHRP